MIVDMGGARTMLDLAVAQQLGLPVDVAGPGHWYGGFWGPASTPLPYYGRMPGPIYVQLSERVTKMVPEIKVVKYGEPLAILGTDILGRNDGKRWSFFQVGFDLSSGKGIITFVLMGLMLSELNL